MQKWQRKRFTMRICLKMTSFCINKYQNDICTKGTSGKRIWYPRNFLLYPKFRMPHPRYLLSHPKSRIRHPRYLLPHPKSRIRHPRYLLRHQKSWIRHPRYLLRHQKSRMPQKFTVFNPTALTSTVAM